MATATGPDLSGAQAAVERLMDDTCLIYGNPEADDVYNPVTRRFDRAADVVVYDGPCKLKEVTTAMRRAEGGRELDVTGYELGLPILEAPELAKGMRVLITSSRRDPHLPGNEYLVKTPIEKSMAIQRKVIVELVTESPAEEQ